MKIDERKGIIDQRLGGVPGVSAGGQGTAPFELRGGDQVSLSDAARDLARLRGEVGDVDAVDHKRVSGLGAVMARGQYSADLRDVAGKMLRELLTDVLA